MAKTNFMFGVLLAVIALMMIVAPEQCIKVAVIGLGLEAIVNGVMGLLRSHSLLNDANFQLAILVRSIMSIVIGLLALILPMKFAASMWTIMLYMLALYLLVAGILQLYVVAKLRNSNIERRRYVIEVVVSFIGAVILVIISQPHFGVFFIRLVGILALLVSIGYLLFEWRNRPIVVDEIEIVDDVDD